MCSAKVESGKTVFALIILSSLSLVASASRFDSLQSAAAVALNNGRVQEAKQWAFEALEIAEATNVRADLALANYRLANCFQASQYFESAVPLYEKAIQLADVAGERSLLARAFTTYGVMKIKMGHFEEGEANVNYALSVAQEQGDAQAIAACHEHLGQSRYYQGRLEEALQSFSTGLELARQLKDQTLLATCFQNIGQVHLDKGAFGLAEEFTDQALDVSLELEEEYHINKCYKNLTYIHLAQGRLADAIQAQVDFYTTLDQHALQVDGEMNAHQVEIMKEASRLFHAFEDRSQTMSRWLYLLGALCVILGGVVLWFWHSGQRKVHYVQDMLEATRAELDNLRKSMVHNEPEPSSLAKRIRPLLHHTNPMLVPCYTMLAANASITDISTSLHRSRKRVYDYMKEIAEALGIDEEEVRNDALKHGRIRQNHSI